MEWISDPNAWIALLTLCLLEIVLGIDNIIFISILSNNLPKEQQKRAVRTGLALALIMRTIMLLSISWIMSLTTPIITLMDKGFSGRDIILLLGGLFLIYKSVKEIHHKIDLQEDEGDNLKSKAVSFRSVILQIVLIDLIFSLDSVITAVGMVEQVSIMIIAVVFSIGVMMFMALPISNFVNKHPAIKILALAFLVMIGTALIAEGMGFHIPKGYIYSSLAFALAIEFINIKASSRKVA
jgi:predicted tellurium resistance membrane protein TerC